MSHGSGFKKKFEQMAVFVRFAGRVKQGKGKIQVTRVWNWGRGKAKRKNPALGKLNGKTS